MIVVGSVNVDLVARADHLPVAGETVTGATFSRHDGGKGGNQAVAAVRLGAPTAFVGAVGDDDFGIAARAGLAAEGIDLSGLTTVPGPTGVAVILVDRHGENVIAVAPGANVALTPADVLAALTALEPGDDDVVLVGCEIPVAAVRAALRAGGDAGATTILNPGPAGGLDRSVFGLADIITPNRGELAELAATEARRVGRASGTADRLEVAARSLLDASSEGDGVRRAVIVTLGASGALVVERSGTVTDVPAPVVAAVDSVGAGDTFSGVLAAGLAAGLELLPAVHRATAAAALSTLKVGAREGMPNTAELEAAVASR